jgi:hypothetical protein
MGGTESPSPRPTSDTVPAAPHTGVHRHDDLDELIEAVLGPTTAELPGRLDAGLLAAGAALVAWWFVSGFTGPWGPVGVALLGLGTAVPIRTAVLAANVRRWERRRDG